MNSLANELLTEKLSPEFRLILWKVSVYINMMNIGKGKTLNVKVINSAQKSWKELQNASEVDAFYYLVRLMIIVHLITNALIKFVSFWGNVANIMTVDLALIVWMDFVQLKNGELGNVQKMRIVLMRFTFSSNFW